MPETSRTRTWSIPTSPRSPYKLRSTVALLLPFEGRIWNSETQTAYARVLASSDVYEGAVSIATPDFAARDRVNRAPKALGFVRLGRNRPLEITDAGRLLIEGIGEKDLFLRQLLKWQYPSPNHNGPDYVGQFCIKPFLEALRLIRDLNGLSKLEIALFCLSLVDWKGFDAATSAIRAFRENLSLASDPMDRRRFVQHTTHQRVVEIYQEDVMAGRIRTRESLDHAASLKKFYETKASNLRDYADSSIRYFLATGLFTLSGSAGHYRLKISEERRAEADDLLAHVARVPEPYSDQNAFFRIMGNPALPVLPSDNVTILRKQITDIYSAVGDEVAAASGISRSLVESETDPRVLKTMAGKMQGRAIEVAIADQRLRLKYPEAIDDVLQVFDQIRKDEVPWRSLFLEWNTWRGLTSLDDGAIGNNFLMDRFGQPTSTAPGKVPDIVCEYADFHLAVEVTLSRGATQYKSESEPVNRHVGQLQRQKRDSQDFRPVYGLFIAEQLSPTVITHFYCLHRIGTSEYAGPVSVIPLCLGDFEVLLGSARNHVPIRSSSLHDFLRTASLMATECSDEREWYAGIRALACNWRPVAGASSVTTALNEA